DIHVAVGQIDRARSAALHKLQLERVLQPPRRPVRVLAPNRDVPNLHPPMLPPTRTRSAPRPERAPWPVRRFNRSAIHTVRWRQSRVASGPPRPGNPDVSNEVIS